MQSNVFVAMLKTQYQVASPMQIAGTCDSGAQKSNQKIGGSSPHAEQCVFGHAENTVPGCQPHADCWHMWFWCSEVK